MDHTAHHERHREVARLQHDFPGYRIWAEALGGNVRLVAVTRQPGASPHTLITADPAELRASLAPHQATATASPGQPVEDYPQAIADDYPGWEVRHHDGQWTAWCPAVTVRSATAADLRAAIEHAITSTDQT